MCIRDRGMLGIVLFYIGLGYGLVPLAGMTGQLAAGVCFKVDEIDGSPLMGFNTGLVLLVCCTLVLVGAMTGTEPGLRTLAMEIRSYTHNDFPQHHATGFASVGFAVGACLAVCIQVFAVPGSLLILPGYCLAVLLSMCSPERSVSIAWDLSSAASGMLLGPFLVSFGLAFQSSITLLAGRSGFGLQTLASLLPILLVLTARFAIEHHRHSTSSAFSAIDMQLETPPDLYEWQMDSSLESFELELDGLDASYGSHRSAERQPFKTALPPARSS
eukprot:TRINITY_DN7619_c0_g1_i3.p1 TRINITY_DN7619_c0_g1~~TRINITY_DN7619_c0_g1_i3.p1  ORF type:complete len:273 (-),score=63.63 TRINITY_DN7619_c0_g1_i3:473-1291(-)